MSLFGFAVAGALSGAGKGLVEDARAKREAMMEERREARADRRAQEGRDFQERMAEESFKRESGLTREGWKFQADESEKDRAARLAEAAANRAAADKRAATDREFRAKENELGRRHQLVLKELDKIENQEEREFRMEIAQRGHEWALEKLVKGDELVTAREQTAYERELEKMAKGDELITAREQTAYERELERMATQRAYQVEDREDTQKFQNEQDEKRRGFSAAQSAEDRKNAKDLTQMRIDSAQALAKGQGRIVESGGVAMVVFGDKATPLTGPDGKPISIDKTASGKDAGARATVFKAIVDLLQEDFTDDRSSTDKVAEARKLTNQFFGSTDAASTSPPAKSSPTKGPDGNYSVTTPGELDQLIKDGLVKPGDKIRLPNNKILTLGEK